MEQALTRSHGKPGRWPRIGAAILFAALAAVARPEGVRVESKTVGEPKGEAGPTTVLQFSIGKGAYRSLGTPGWKWTSDAMGYDAAAFGPNPGISVIGVRTERLNDPSGKSIERMGPAAHAALRKKWDAEVAGGSVTILSWEGAPGAEEVTVRYRRMEDGRELEGCERSFFGEGCLITLGMLADTRQLGLVQSMFARLNGSFAKVER